MNRRVVGELVALVLMMWSGIASADLREALDQMFLAAGNEPQIYESQRRSGLDMGTLRLRAPVRSVRVIQLSAPDVSAGCGGIDLYGGSFSFINEEEFRQLLRQIGANAIGYSFKLALATMCEACDRHLTNLQDMMNKLNQGSLNSCRWAQGLVNDFAKSLPNSENIRGMSRESARANFDDFIAAQQALFANSAEFLGGGDPSGADPANEDVGNLTWNALRAANTAALFPFANGNLSTDEVLLNIAGTFIVRAASDAEFAGGDSGVASEPLGSLLSFRELMNGKWAAQDGSGDALKMYQCDEMAQCLEPNNDLDTWSFPGVRMWVEEQLQAAADHVNDPVTAGTPHPPDFIEFLGGLPMPVTRHLIELQGSSALTIYVQQAAPYITDAYGVTMANTFAQVIRRAYARSDSPSMPPNVEENLRVFEADVKAAQTLLNTEQVAKFLELEELVGELSRQMKKDVELYLVGGSEKE